MKVEAIELEDRPLFIFTINKDNIIVVNESFNKLSRNQKQELLVALTVWSTNQMLSAYNYGVAQIKDFKPKRNRPKPVVDPSKPKNKINRFK